MTVPCTNMCNDLDFYSKPMVLVTGFGPFIGHPVNASWEAVKLMDKAAVEREHGVELVTLELPVTYSNVDEFVPALWETHEPKLMIHVGVSSAAECLTLETQAHRKGYRRQDYLERCPAEHACGAAGPARLHTQLDVERICAELDLEPALPLRAVASRDAGRYLCEYIYYTSLSIDKSRTLFVHVPELRVSPASRTARALERLLARCLAQLRERDPACACAQVAVAEVSARLGEASLRADAAGHGDRL